MMKRAIAFTLTLSLGASGCFVRGPGIGLFEAALVTAVIISAVQPPPPRVVFVPEPREGYVWQPGYWTQTQGDWVWTDGGWVPDRPAMRFVPSHWEQMPDGRWQLIPAQWAPA
jgi:WXXGXW repeat (2 copies)